MDKGAHFYKADLQVHTPRDINWQGDRPAAQDRPEFAREFVAACRGKGLQAVAITDHHDLAFFKFIRDAAQSETDAKGKPLPVAERLVVFPGMEPSQPSWAEEQRIVERWRKEVTQAATELRELRGRLQRLPTPLESTKVQYLARVRTMEQLLRSMYADADGSLALAEKALAGETTSREKLKASAEKWVRAVNNLPDRPYGKWGYVVCRNPNQLRTTLDEIRF
jgi:hypothetical protein